MGLGGQVYHKTNCTKDTLWVGVNGVNSLTITLKLSTWVWSHILYLLLFNSVDDSPDQAVDREKKKNIIFPGSNTDTDLRWSHHTPPGIPRMRSNWQGQPTKKNWSTSVWVLHLLVYETLSHCVYDLPLVRGVHLPVYSFEKNLGDNHRTRSCRPNVEATAPTHRSAHLRHCRTQSVLKRRLTPTAPDRSADKGRSDKDQKLPLMMNVNLGSL